MLEVVKSNPASDVDPKDIQSVKDRVEKNVTRVLFKIDCFSIKTELPLKSEQKTF